MKKSLPRRTVLRAGGITVALPMLECMTRSPAVKAAAASPQDDDPQTADSDVRRMLAIGAPLGIHTPNLFPTKSGRDYEVTPYLKPLQPYRDKWTVISGLMHPDVDGGHPAEKSFLTAAPHPGHPSFKNTISVDQFAAEQIGYRTRFSSLTLASDRSGLSYTRSGVQIPSETRPSRLFAKLFLEGTKEEQATQLRRIKDGQSVMDLVRNQTAQVAKRASRQDNQTLDQYMTSVRELEQRLVQAEDWAQRPKPIIDQKPPTDVQDRADFVGRMRLMYEMIFLAFQSDSTRLITFLGAGGNEVVSLPGVEDGWHNLSHHGRDPEKLEMLAIIELEEFKLFGELLGKLDGVREGEHTLLDQTSILMGSNLGNASSHNNSNLPIIAAGGRFQHGQHLAFAPQKGPPLANLFVSQLQHLGLETDRFANGTGTLTGI